MNVERNQKKELIRRDFPKFAALAGALVLLAACLQEPTQTKTSTATVKRILPTNTQFPTQTLNATAVPPNIDATQTAVVQQAEQTQEAQQAEETQAAREQVAQHEPGEWVWNPDYGIKGVDINKENMQKARSFFLDTLYILNPEYFEAFNQEFGQNITDGGSLEKWLKENDWILPLLSDGTGMRLITNGVNNGYIRRGAQLDADLSLKNPEFYFFSSDQYQEQVANYKNPLIKINTMFWVRDDEEWESVKVGLSPIRFTNKQGQEIYKIGFMMANNKNVKGSISEAGATQEDIDNLALYVPYFFYELRALKPPTEINWPVGYPNEPLYHWTGAVDKKGFAKNLFVLFRFYSEKLSNYQDGDILEYGPAPPPPIFELHQEPGNER
jgi:hypothetical protein